MQMPKKLKHRKWHKGRSKSALDIRGSRLSFGSMGLKTLEADWLTSRQIESARRAMTRAIKRGGKIWIRVFPDRPRTKKGSEVPMGKGKGAVDHFVSPVKPGRVLFEIDGVPEDVAREALRLAAHKLPVRTVVVTKDSGAPVAVSSDES